MPHTIPPYEQFSSKVYLLYARAWLAEDILMATGMHGFSKWKPEKHYNDSSDPVYQALMSFTCAEHEYHLYRSKIVDKYCGGDVSDTYLQIEAIKEKYNAQTINRLTYPGAEICKSSVRDPLEQVMLLSDLNAFFKYYIDHGLEQCHSYNVLVRGVSCLMTFHANSPKLKDLNEYLPFMCKAKRLNDLQMCWDMIVEACRSNMVYFIDDVVSLHHTVCNISTNQLAGDFVNRWAGVFKQKPACQVFIQGFAVTGVILSFRYAVNDTTSGMMDALCCMMSSLNDTIKSMPGLV